MESVLLTSCLHIVPLRTQKGLQRVARAAELVHSCANRPIIATSNPNIPKCLHPTCQVSGATNVFVCVECVYFACMPSINFQQNNTSKIQQSQPYNTHLHHHHAHSSHKIYLSVEHDHLFCIECDDYIFDRYLDSAIALQKYIAQSEKGKFLISNGLNQTLVEKSSDPIIDQGKRRFRKRRLRTEKEWVPSKEEMKIIGQNTGLLSSILSTSITELELPVGLFNLGNSCYMNSVLQAFLNAPALRNFFLADQHRPYCKKKNETDCLACAIDRLICDSCFIPNAQAKKKEKGNGANSLTIPFLVPHKILDIVWRHSRNLATYAQHDAHEFLIAALNILHSHSQRVEESPPRKYTKREPDLQDIEMSNDQLSGKDGNRKEKGESENVQKDVCDDELLNESESAFEGISSIAKTLFSGTLQSDVICSVCGNSSPTLEDFYDIALDVDKLVKPVSTRRSRAPSPNAELGNSDSTKTGQRGARSQTHAHGEELPFKDKFGNHTDNSTDMNSGVESGKLNMVSESQFATDKEKDSDPFNSIYECLSRFTKPETLDSSSKMHCSVCECRQEARKQMSIRTLPAIVCFHFKRFEQSFANTGRSEMVKNETPVEFPVDGLDLSQFRTSKVVQRRNTTKSKHATAEALVDAIDKNFHNSQRNDNEGDQLHTKDPKDATYDLFAIVNHLGKIDSGHYTTNVRRQGIWYKCDDKEVSPIGNVEQTIRSGEAYLLFYARRHTNFQF